MLFTKEFLVQKFNEKMTRESYKLHPYESNNQPGEISDGQAEIISYNQYFDLRSEEAKDAMLKARKEALDTCFEEKDMGIYPNKEKVNRCLDNTKAKNFRKFDEHRILYFGNCNYFL